MDTGKVALAAIFISDNAGSINRLYFFRIVSYDISIFWVLKNIDFKIIDFQT